MWTRFLALGITTIFFLASGQTLSAQDVYVVYSGKGKAFKTEVVRTLKAQKLDVKEYNADLLALADYSGKQKVVTKISRADVVIVIGDKPMKNLKGTKIKSNLIIVSSTSKDVKATEELKYVVDQKTKLTGLSGKQLEVKAADDLKDEDGMEKADILIVHQPAMSLPGTIGALTSMFAG